MTGVSAVGAFSGLVIGAIGTAMMLVGGSSIRNGTMTIRRPARGVAVMAPGRRHRAAGGR